MSNPLNNKNNFNQSQHNPINDMLITVVIDSVLYDIWDCRHELCDTVWKRVD